MYYYTLLMQGGMMLILTQIAAIYLLELFLKAIETKAKQMETN